MSYKTDFESGSWSAIDTNKRLTDPGGTEFLRILKDKNIDVIIRYYASNRRSKTITPEEAKLICQRGFKLLPVYQDTARRPTDFGVTNGYKNAIAALQFANYIGQPQGTTILFACDADFSLADCNRYIKPYFREINRVFNGRYRVGCYGSGLILKELWDDKLIEVPWLSMSRSFRGTEEYFYSYMWAIKQLPPPLKWKSYNYDRNVANWNWDMIGAFSVADAQPEEMIVSMLEQVKDYFKNIFDKLNKKT